MSERPHWEHGFRCHGYWIGLDRVGWVSIGPRPNRVEITGYSWGVVHPLTAAYIEGRSVRLKQAKRAVEKLWASLAHLREMREEQRRVDASYT